LISGVINDLPLITYLNSKSPGLWTVIKVAGANRLQPFGKTNSNTKELNWFSLRPNATLAEVRFIRSIGDDKYYGVLFGGKGRSQRDFL
jgi:hypothetical protein